MEFGPVIKNPVLDINKLVRQGTMLNQSVQNVEGDSTADQATVDLLARKDPVIQEIAVGMSGEELTQYTVSGTPPLSLPNSLGKPLKAWSVDLLPYQEGSGDPSPDNVRPIHGTDKVNLFVEESYDPSATPKAVITLPQTVYTGTIGSEGGESRSAYRTFAELGADTRWNRLTSGTFAFYINRIFALPNCSYPLPEQPLSTHYTYLQSGTMQNETFRVSDALYIVDNRFESIADFRAWLSSTDGGFWYRSTPTTFAVPSPTIPTPTGTATTWATAEDGTVESMEVSYLGTV